MATVREIAAKTAAIAEEAARVASSLDYEANEISMAMGRVQDAFGDQSQGQQAIASLNTALGSVVSAGTAMGNGRTHSSDFISRIMS